MGCAFSTWGALDFKAISGVDVCVAVVESPPPNGMGVSVIIGAADIKRGEEVSVIAFAGSGNAGAWAAGADSCDADKGAAAPTADGIRAVAKLRADKEINPLITKVMMNKKVASAVAKRKT